MSKYIDMHPVRFDGPGYLTAKIPDDVLTAVWKDVQEVWLNQQLAQERDLSDALAGNIKKEVEIFNSRKILMNNLILPMTETYVSYFNAEKLGMEPYGITKFKDEQKQRICFSTVWANFMRKGEFNPPHSHSGLYSFVLWLKTPYTLDEELKHAGVQKSNTPRVGAFSFYYTNPLGTIQDWVLPVDSSWDGMCALFPAGLKHEVFPFFTSDDVRVSVAGNVILDHSNLEVQHG